jgi:arylsulfatase A-like enzyme
MPVVAALAKQARDHQCFSPSNLCAPARCGVLTGQMQNRFGIYQNSDVEATGLPPGVVLAWHLQKAVTRPASLARAPAGNETREAAVRDAKPVNPTGYLARWFVNTTL